MTTNKKTTRAWIGRFGVIAVGVAIVVGSETANADDGRNVDKSGFHLANPTPKHLMRPMSADRPDATESPITVDAGHTQVELSFLSFTHNDADGVRTDSWAFFDTNVKVGLLNNVDIQFVFSAYNEEETDTAGQPEATVNGFGDLQIRLKINLWGNDPGEDQATAFGIMPFIKIPTGTELSNDQVEGGFIWMLGWDVAEHWGLGFQAEVDFVYDEADDGYDTEFLHTAVLGFDVVGPVGAYIEYVGIASADPETDYQAIFSGGLTYELNEDVVFDVGTQVGLTESADDVTVFVGMTTRY